MTFKDQSLQDLVNPISIKDCQHPHPKAAGMGYALCDKCGALLPDDDPDLQAKAEAH